MFLIVHPGFSDGKRLELFPPRAAAKSRQWKFTNSRLSIPRGARSVRGTLGRGRDLSRQNSRSRAPQHRGMAHERSSESALPFGRDARRELLPKSHRYLRPRFGAPARRKGAPFTRSPAGCLELIFTESQASMVRARPEPSARKPAAASPPGRRAMLRE